MSLGNINSDGSIKLTGHKYEVTCTNEHEKYSKIDGKLSEFVEDVFKKLRDTDQSITRIKTEATNIKDNNSGLVTLGRLMRSISLIALYALGIITVIPALFCTIQAIKALNESPRGTSVIDIAHRYITLKSQERLNIEDDWDKIKENANKLKNHTNVKANFIVTQHTKKFIPERKTETNIYIETYHLEGALELLNQKKQHIDKTTEIYKATIEKIRTALEKTSPFDA